MDGPADLMISLCREGTAEGEEPERLMRYYREGRRADCESRPIYAVFPG